MPYLILATGNLHKVEEIRSILGDGPWDWLTLRDFPDAPIAIEDADTFAGNATKKAASLAQWLAQQPGAHRQHPVAWVLADDSGLEVDALNGAPGVHSARFAALETNATGNSRDADNNAKLLRLLNDVPDVQRAARFRCCIAVVQLSGGPCLLFDGACEGKIARAPSGQGGFGYDPLFIPSGFNRSFAELSGEVKNKISHRAVALAKLAQWLRTLPG